MPDISRYLELSKKVDYDDLDWDQARSAGLTERELHCLPYFADIEAQTIFYALELLKLRVAREPNTISFITLWNYEEHFHARAIEKLLEECGESVDEERIVKVRVGARLKARLEDAAQVALSRLFPRAFVALWMTWGASQELVTLRAYQELGSTTQNPVLEELCRRIAKQERRHFSFYYARARECLEESAFARRFTRTMLERFWSPVGSGVKSEDEAAELVCKLWQGEALTEMSGYIDEMMGRLPGLEGIGLMTPFADRVQQRLPRSGSLQPAA